METYIDWFTDREKQHEGFQRMLSRDWEKQIMVVTAEAAMGKTWLIQREYHECRVRQIPVARIDFVDPSPWDYLTLVRRIRDQLGPEYFNHTTQTINDSTTVNIRLTAPESGDITIDVGTDEGRIEDSSVSIHDVIGSQATITDSYFHIQTDDENACRVLAAQINDAFFTDLRRLSQQQVTALLIDTFDKISAEANQWLRGEFLVRLRDEEALRNVLVMLAGRNTPEFSDAWRHVMAKTDLLVFGEEHAREYFRLRKLDIADIPDILKKYGGEVTPGDLAKAADERDADSDDGWWV